MGILIKILRLIVILVPINVLLVWILVLIVLVVEGSIGYHGQQIIIVYAKQDISMILLLIVKHVQ